MYKCVCGYNAPYFECIVKDDGEVTCPKCDMKMTKMTVKIKRLPISPIQPLETPK